MKAGRKPEEDRPLTAAERQARIRVRKATQAECWLLALEQIANIRTAKEARDIATKALNAEKPDRIKRAAKVPLGGSEC